MSDYLLDTHSFLWSVFEPERLSKPVHAELANRSSTVYVSSVSFWEIALKVGIGKLVLTNCLPEELPGIADGLGYLPLPMEADEAASFYRLPRYAHKDPFDRMLIWQAVERELILISKDSAFDAYRAMGLQTFW